MDDDIQSTRNVYKYLTKLFAWCFMFERNSYKMQACLDLALSHGLNGKNKIQEKLQAITSQGGDFDFIPVLLLIISLKDNLK